MRRTLALAGAVILAAGLGGLASGTASADHGVTHDVETSEVAVDLDTTFQDDPLEGTAVELQNNDKISSKSLDRYELRGCTASADFLIFDFGPSDVIAADDQFLIADPSSYSGPTAEAFFATPARGQLNQDDGGVRLIDTITGLVVNGVQWGMPDDACTSLDPADGSASPTDTHSLNYDTSIDVWCAAPAKPHEPSPSCAS